MVKSPTTANSSIISLDGGVNNGHSIAITGGTNIKINSTTANNNIEIEAPQYTLTRGALNSDTIPISLNQDGEATATRTVNFIAGNHLSFDSSNTTAIKINHDAPGVGTAVYGIDATATTVNINAANTSSATPYIVIPSIKVDEYGHVSSIDNTTVSLNGAKQMVQYL